MSARVRVAPPPPPVRRVPRWLAGAGVAAGVVAVVVAVQAVAGGDSEVGAAGTVASSAPESETEMAVALFGAEAEAPDVTRTSSDDAAGQWPVSGCAGPGVVEAGRVDFVAGTERGLEYRRDLAIGWYADAAAAQAAYDAVVERVTTCAAEAGAAVTVEPSSAGDAGSVFVATSAEADGAGVDGVSEDGGAEDGAVVEDGAVSEADVSLTAVSLSGSVVVLAVDHAGFYGAPPAESVAGTAAQAERLLTEACRVAAGGC